mmetsp:Transcript_2196/g.2538  ORF Transcript_2196/g.2538 Transcript_2196/m.2538 type:complete len:298 (+) Transcript_2196:74-967(+)
MLACTGWTCLRVGALVLALGSSLLLLFLLVLRMDGLASLRGAGWASLLLPPSVGLACSGVLWAAVRFFALSSRQTKDVHMILRCMQSQAVQPLEAFSKGFTFSAVLFGVTFAVHAGLSFVFFRVSSCAACPTPYEGLFLGLCLLYVCRLGLLYYGANRHYRRLKALVVALDAYHASCDADRLLARLPQFQYDSATDYARWASMIAWALTAVLGLLGTVWALRGNCQASCALQFSHVQIILMGVSGTEASYVLCSLLTRFFRRTSGLEKLDALVHSLAREALEKGSTEALTARYRSPS